MSDPRSVPLAKNTMRSFEDGPVPPMTPPLRPQGPPPEAVPGGPIATIRDGLGHAKDGFLDCGGDKCRLPNCRACYGDSAEAFDLAAAIAALDQLGELVRAAQDFHHRWKHDHIYGFDESAARFEAALLPFETSTEEPEPE